MTDKYKLTCLVEGDKIAFPIVISRDADIDHLTALIYEKRKKGLFRDIDPFDLALWKVDINLEPLLDHLSKFKLNHHHHRTKLSNLSLPVSHLWNEQPPVLNLHVFVTLPSGDGDPAPLPPSSQLHLTSVSEARAALAPSSVTASAGKYKQEQIDHPIYNGRPIERRGPPVVIYNEHLARLKDELCHLTNAPEPSADYVTLTADLFHAAATIYSSEKDRGNAIYNYLERLLGTSLDRSVSALERNSNRKTTEADAVVRKPIESHYFGNTTAVVAYMELKNELGIRGDGGLQAALSLRKYVVQERYNSIRNASTCPCVIISVAGPYLMIAGAVFVEVFSVQNFTSYIYMGGDPYETEQVYYVAKVFDAVARAVRALGEQYYFLDPESQLEFRLPSPTHLPNSPFPANGSSFKIENRFMYERRQHDSYRRSLFLAEYEGKTVVVKFCERYGEDAHRALADAGLAPKLHYCSKLVGGVFMVVMEFVEGRDAYSEFKYRDLPRTVLEDVKGALGMLHDGQLVYGDMRRPNIMMVKAPKSQADDSEDEDEDVEEWRGLLVDFDWSGQVGVVKYPPTLNTSGEIKWAKGVEPAVEIKQKHDLDMLEKIINGTDE